MGQGVSGVCVARAMHGVGHAGANKRIRAERIQTLEVEVKAGCKSVRNLLDCSYS